MGGKKLKDKLTFKTARFINLFYVYFICNV